VLSGRYEALTEENLEVRGEDQQLYVLPRQSVYEIRMPMREPGGGVPGLRSSLFSGYPGDVVFAQVESMSEQGVQLRSGNWSGPVQVPLSALEFWRPVRQHEEVP
jgi:hypothetical protein